MESTAYRTKSPDHPRAAESKLAAEDAVSTLRSLADAIEEETMFALAVSVDDAVDAALHASNTVSAAKVGAPFALVD